jgi:hypothetical protein
VVAGKEGISIQVNVTQVLFELHEHDDQQQVQQPLAWHHHPFHQTYLHPHSSLSSVAFTLLLFVVIDQVCIKAKPTAAT